MKKFILTLTSPVLVGHRHKSSLSAWSNSSEYEAGSTVFITLDGGSHLESTTPVTIHVTAPTSVPEGPGPLVSAWSVIKSHY
ncbi:MAG: hypothetical protein QF492_02060 [Candidatus Krumholzibacteria bacterium]|jgi:hypothetical protein|nr:hypothetical protein [Candidatus Krumholzibacteria bacterium]MDP6668679.1 hypothetical protein [Candidatus Krumholzibacteria bacterium]MDP6797892.1 hypothetical protein [Candidatus Krumholzibacteria bacterium]MDP7021772.1 hypothetical protein [Candidatus Krumholzibacteria bacterium]